MEKQFKQNLLNLRSPKNPSTFSEALFGQPSWIKKKRASSIPQRKVLSSEKIEVIESLEAFTIAQAIDGKLQLDQAEILIRPAKNHRISISKDELIEELTTPMEVREILLSNKTPDQVKVLFVTENLGHGAIFRVSLKQASLMSFW